MRAREGDGWYIARTCGGFSRCRDALSCAVVDMVTLLEHRATEDMAARHTFVHQSSIVAHRPLVVAGDIDPALGHQLVGSRSEAIEDRPSAVASCRVDHSQPDQAPKRLVPCAVLLDGHVLRLACADFLPPSSWLSILFGSP